MGRNVPNPISGDRFGSTSGTALTTHNSVWASIGNQGTSNTYDVANMEITVHDSNGCGTGGAALAAGARYTGIVGTNRDICNVVVRDIANPADDDFGICIQATSTRRGYHVRFSNYTGQNPGTCTLYEDNGTTTTQRDQNTSYVPNFNGNANHFLERSPDGYIRYYWDGYMYLEWEDTSNLTGGDPGFYKEADSTAADVVWDNFWAGPSHMRQQWHDYPGEMSARRLFTWYEDADASNLTTDTFAPEDGSILVVMATGANSSDNVSSITGLDSAESWRPISCQEWQPEYTGRFAAIWACRCGNETPGTLTITRGYSWRQTYTIWEIKGAASMPLEQTVVGANVRGWLAPSAFHEEVYMRPDNARHAISVVSFMIYGGRPGEGLDEDQLGSSGELVGGNMGGFASYLEQQMIGGADPFYTSYVGSSAGIGTSGFRVYGREK